jgi:hypothetical protein
MALYACPITLANIFPWGLEDTHRVAFIERKRSAGGKLTSADGSLDHCYRFAGTYYMPEWSYQVVVAAGRQKPVRIS